MGCLVRAPWAGHAKCQPLHPASPPGHDTAQKDGKPSRIFHTSAGQLCQPPASAGGRLKVTATTPGLQPAKRHRGSQGEELQ